MQFETPAPAPVAPEPDVIACAGEMARRLLAYDWSSSPLGPMNQWPQSLRTAVQIALNSRFPMFIWWGDELINIYNDAYIPILGARHPSALGHPAQTIWSEIWESIGPRVKAVFDRQEATFDENLFLLMARSGYPEETYFTFSYSPLYDEQGQVSGLFCACTEETGKVIGERRLRTLRDLLKQAADNSHSLDGACRAAITTLNNARQDIPFACLYLADTASPHPIFSYATHDGLDSQLWALTEPLQTQPATWHVEQLPRDWGLNAASSQHPVLQAVILRLDVSAQRAASNALLVLGVSPLCPLNEAYQEYMRLIASQIGMAITRAYETERYRLVMQATHDGIWDYNLNTRKAVWDGLYHDMIGYREHELDEVNLDFMLSRIHPDDRSKVVQRWQQCVHDITPYESQYRLQHQAGHYLQVVSKGTPILDQNGIPYRMVGVIVDITEEICAMQAMRESEARFRAIADEAPVYIFIADVDMKVIFLNKTWLTYTGLSIEDALGLSWQDITPPEDIELVAKVYTQAVANRDAFSFEIRHRGTDGQYRWTLWKGIPRFMPDGQFMGFMGSGIDIHERKELEEALQLSEGHFRTVANKAPVMLWITDENHHCTYINQTWLDFTGQTIEEIQGFGWLEKIHPDDLEAAKTAFVEAASQQKFFQVDYRLLRKDGVYRWTTDAGAPLFDGKGRFQGYIGYVIDITGRKLAEEALKASEDRLASAISASEVGTWRVDLKSGLDTRDATLNRILGLDARESVEPIEDFFGRIHPDDQPIAKQAWDSAYNGEEGLYDLDTRIVLPDGEVRWVRDRGRIIRDESGQPLYATGAVADITGRKQVEAALEAARQQSERVAVERSTILNQLTEGVIVTDPAGQIVFVNESAARLHGVGRLDVAPEHYSETYHLFTEDGQPYPVEELPLSRAVFNGETTLDARWRIHRPDGTEILAIGSACPLLGSDGVKIGAVLTLRDDTVREASERALQESEVRFRTMADSAPVLIWQSDLSKACFYFNKPWLEFTGRSLAQEQGGGWAEGVHPDDLDQCLDTYVNSFDARQEFKMEYRLRRHDGHYRWLLDHGVPRVSPDGEFLGYVGSCIDIHERKQMEHELQRAKQQAEEASRKKSEFLALMSHELRTPLNAILGYSRMIETGMMGPVNDKQAQYLGNVGTSGQHLLTLINDLLDVSKIEAGKMDIARERMAVAPLVAEVETMMQAFARKQLVTLVVRLDPDIGEIEADPARCKQILVNLLNNAIKFNKPQGSVVLELVRQSDWIVATVQDNGIGVEAEDLPHLFGKFYQVDISASRRQEGTGLGLALTRDLVELHGGAVTVVSEKDVGTTFTVRLPIRAPGPAPAVCDRDSLEKTT